MTGALWRSAFVAALFALHPLHVESVAWVAERKDVLSAFFCLLTTLGLRRATRGRPRDGATSLVARVCFALGLMAKPMLVTLPFVLLCCSTSGRCGASERMPLPAALLREKLPLFALAGASSVVTFLVQQRGGRGDGARRRCRSPRGSQTRSVAYVTYLGTHALAGRPRGVLSVSARAVRPEGRRRVVRAGRRSRPGRRACARAPYLAVGWLWYVGMLVPVIGIVQVGLQAMADRYTYLPLVGVFIMVVWGLTDLLGATARSRTVLEAAAALAIAACAVLTWRQVG